MQDKKKRIYAKRMHCAELLLIVLLLLCGCTRKEELLLLSGESDSKRQEPAAGEMQAFSAEAVKTDAQGGLPEGQEASAQTEPPGVICVHVCGAVRLPGVYELAEGSRAYEAVQAAGGFAEGADQNYVNQAQTLCDGVKLVIPTVEETAQIRESGGLGGTAAQIGMMGETAFDGTGSSGQAENGTGRININTATEAQLCDIPGIGATRAAAIIAYRESHGGFQKPEDIMKVNGIKEGMYEKIKDSISVN